MSFGCGKHRSAQISQGIDTIAVLTTTNNLGELTKDQSRDLKVSMEWMHQDITKLFKETGYRVIILDDFESFRPEMGILLLIDIEGFKTGDKAAKTFVGLGAGSSMLSRHYKLFNDKMSLILEWRDEMTSNKTILYCIRRLDKKAMNKILDIISD
jgi:hypothetical protein